MKGLTVTVGDAGNTCVSCKLHVRGGRKRCNDVRLDHPCRVHNVFTPRGLLPFLLDADDRRWLASNFSRLIAPTHRLYTSYGCATQLYCSSATARSGARCYRPHSLSIDVPVPVDACLWSKWVSTVAFSRPTRA